MCLILKLINKSEDKQLVFASLISPSKKKQNSRKLWKTLNQLLPNKKQHKTANALASENFNGYTSFDYEFFTSVAEKLCDHYKSKTCLPNIAVNS